MANIAIVEKLPTSTRWDEYFEFEYDKFALCDRKVDRVKKSDITLDMSDIAGYDYVITVGAEPTKFIAGVNSVTTYQGTLIGEKFIPIINPNMLKIKPEGEPNFKRALDRLKRIIDGEGYDKDLDIKGIQDTKEAIEYLKWILHNAAYIAMDTETTALYPKDGYVLGISISHKPKQGYYIDTNCLDEECEDLLKKIAATKKVVFHNSKFDRGFIKYHFGIEFANWEDTMMMHFALDENNSHKLKELALIFTKLGDYDVDLMDFKVSYCKRHKIKQADFTYDLIPWEVISIYAGYDTAATIELYIKFLDKLNESPKLTNLYNRLLKPGVTFIMDMELNGVPFDKDRLGEAKNTIGDMLVDLELEFYKHKQIHQVEERFEKKFNPNSVFHLRYLFFDILKLPVTSYTDKGQPSTDKEVLAYLMPMHPVVELVAKYKKWAKIKSTYIDKVIIGLDNDGRLRTNFNLHVTTSGRLSSSGKLNLQQLPRDNPVVKWCIKANEGFKIVSQDLSTAEMYVAAALSKDKALAEFFRTGGDYHGFMAVNKFGLDCDPNEVAKLYPDKRQEAKTVSFEILYKLNLNEPILRKFTNLKRWLKKQIETIESQSFIYSPFGRKRRLLNVESSRRDIAMHDVRSGVNFIIQSAASDINLLAAIEMNDYIKKRGMKSKIIALVHDSVIAEVPDEEIDHYCKVLKELTQKDRGCSIPGVPIGVDVEIGEDYAFGKGGKGIIL